jgi:hypothetical protein
MNFFDHKDLGHHLLQLCPKVVKHPVYNDLKKWNPKNMKECDKQKSHIKTENKKSTELSYISCSFSLRIN